MQAVPLMLRDRDGPSPNRGAAAVCGRHESASALGLRAHQGFDVWMTECQGHRDPMTSVENVVAIWSLDEIDRREGTTGAVSERDPLPARAHDLRGGAEAGVEVNRRFHRPYDGVERNHLDAARRFQPACAFVHSRRMPGALLSLEPASGPSDRMRPPGATEVSLRVKDRHPGGVSGERPEHFATHHKRRRTSCHRASAYPHPLRSPCFPLVSQLERQARGDSPAPASSRRGLVDGTPRPACRGRAPSRQRHSR